MKKLIILSLLIGYVFAKQTILQVKYKNITVNGKTIKVMTISQPDGTWGYYAKANESFNVIVQNKLDQPTVIHWHGLFLPNSQDGTELTQKLIMPNSQYSYSFKLANTGTFWMHSHYGLQEASFAEAPLVIESPQDALYQQVIVMFQDFSFISPEQRLNNLTALKPNSAMHMHSMVGMHMDDMKPTTHTLDLNDIEYGTYLTNYHSLQKPQITIVKSGSQVKLRFINGSSSSNFWIKLGQLQGRAIAVDGHDIQPITGNKFQLATAQRMDIIVKIPQDGGTFPIIGQVEGRNKQTGLILSTKQGHFSIPDTDKNIAPALDNTQEMAMHSIKQVANKKVDQVIRYTLTGNMSPYSWQINNQSWTNVTPTKIQQGKRVELDFINKSMMAHPMHIHGYAFKIVEVNNKKVDGAIRDTILVMPNSSVKVVFDATAPGKWFIHCHTLYHMHTGMMTYIDVIPDKLEI